MMLGLVYAFVSLGLAIAQFAVMIPNITSYPWSVRGSGVVAGALLLVIMLIAEAGYSFVLLVFFSRRRVREQFIPSESRPRVA
jgi:hypothetical protein